MVHIVKGHVFNSLANQLRNQHVFHMSKAIISVSLKKEEIDPDRKFAYVERLDKVLEHVDIDCDSFNKILYQELMSIRKDAEGSVRIMSVVDGLVKHFNLWSSK